MTLRVSGKHMDIGDAFRTRISERIEEALAKYFDGGYSGHVTVEKSANLYAVDAVVHLDTGMTFQATDRAHDPQASFDGAAQKIEKRLRRYKRRLKDHREKSGETSVDISYRILEAIPDSEENEVAEDYAPTIVAENSLSLRPMSVADAVIELDTKDNPVFVFRNAASEHINVVYRREDGNIGWIDPSLSQTAK